jgi:hypothetical protein
VAGPSAGPVKFVVGDEFQVDLEPSSGEALYLNGTVMATDEHIQNTADALGDMIEGICVVVNGSYVWMFNTANANWVEASP